MSKALRPHRLAGLLLATAVSLAGASAQTSSAPHHKQLDRMDLGVSAMGEITSSVSGTNYLNVPVADNPSTTVGVLLTLRYTKSPLIGFEANYGYARYVQDYTHYVPGGVQANADEYTLGYVAHPRQIFGLDPFVGAGLGAIAFKPTRYGGQGLYNAYRATYYYTIGADDYFPAYHVGLRAAFRQNVYLAPDFGQNYLTITRRAITSEPTIGFFLRF